MLTTILLSLFLADPTPQQVELLKTFRGEFIAITPGEGKFPASLRLAKNRVLALDHDLEIAKYEVPQDLWEAVMGTNPSRWKGKRNSVEMLSFDEAEQFCGKATLLMRAGRLIKRTEVIRLPTETEWEYCARAGTTTRYSFGDDAAQLDGYAWHTGNAAGNDPPVGAKKPNPWGLHDVHGYLWEWCQSDLSDSEFALRGGSWKDTAERLTSSYKRTASRDLRDDAVGLRCVLANVTANQASGRGQPPGGAAPPATVAVADGAAGRFQPTAQHQIVPAAARLEPLWTEGEFTEGPALAPDGSILFSDIGNTMYRYDPKTGQTAVFRKPSGRSNGLVFNQKGDLVACEGANTGGNRRISITAGIDGAKDGMVRTLADRIDGKRFNSPNDLAIDAAGNVYFTDPRYVGSDPRDLDYEGVFIVAPSGKVRVATRDVQKPNGILVSPDGRAVYVSDNNPQGNRHLCAFAVRPDGTLVERRVLHDFGSGRGIDGMTLDREGNIYATAGTGDKAGVYVFAPDGKQLAMIPTPGDPTNCTFGGGADASTLYVTAANSKQPGTKYGLFRIKLNATGHHVVKLK